MHCPNCGAEMQPGKMFCAGCGGKITVADVKRPGSGNATAGLVLGILCLVFAFLYFPLGLVLGIPGIICSSLGLKSKHTRAKVGLGLSISGFVISLILTLLYAFYVFAIFSI